jgi:hypothetical protein
MTSRRPLRILTLLARHGTERYPDALSDVRAMFAHQMPDAAHRIVVIDNSLPPEHKSILASDVELIGSTNLVWEFSAWDRGTAHCGSLLEQFDFINLVTSAFKALDHAHLACFNERMLGLVRGRPAAVGHIDYFDSEVVCFGTRSQSWMRSSFIVLPPAQLRQLTSVTTVTDRSAIFSGDPAMPFKDDAPLSLEFRRYIVGWLTGDGTGQGAQWHSRFALNASTLGTFEDKTLAIINEHMLTQRLRALGCDAVDATWLALQAQSPNRDGILPTIPNWQDQIANRHRKRAPWPLRLLRSTRLSDLWRQRRSR